MEKFENVYSYIPWVSVSHYCLFCCSLHETVLKMMPQRWEIDNLRFRAKKQVAPKKALHFCKLLSTPHGALGTLSQSRRYHPIRCLSTPHGTLGTSKLGGLMQTIPTQLSTPHGTLGTHSSRERMGGPQSFQLHTVHQELTNHMDQLKSINIFQLHTVHQEQTQQTKTLEGGEAFNSTRYIRNERKKAEEWILKRTFNSTRYITNL